jgi:serine phosphatase RsbU (regulator of sigma subunit)
MNPAGEQFGLDRLDATLGNCRDSAETLIRTVLRRVDEFADGHPPDDDRTLLVGRVT